MNSAGPDAFTQVQAFLWLTLFHDWLKIKNSLINNNIQFSAHPVRTLSLLAPWATHSSSC